MKKAPEFKNCRTLTQTAWARWAVWKRYPGTADWNRLLHAYRDMDKAVNRLYVAVQAMHNTFEKIQPKYDAKNLPMKPIGPCPARASYSPAPQVSLDSWNANEVNAWATLDEVLRQLGELVVGPGAWSTPGACPALLGWGAHAKFPMELAFAAATAKSGKGRPRDNLLATVAECAVREEIAGGAKATTAQILKVGRALFNTAPWKRQGFAALLEDDKVRKSLDRHLAAKRKPQKRTGH